MKRKYILIIICFLLLTISTSTVSSAPKISKSKITTNDIISLIGSNKNVVLNTIGNKYQYRKTGITNKDTGYYYKELNVYLYFNKFDKLQYIQKSGETTLFEKRIENNFSSVMESFGYKEVEKYHMGDGKRQEIFAEEDNLYSLTYNYKDYVVEFVSNDKTGKDLKIFIYKPNSLLDEKTLAKLLTASQKDIILDFGNEYIVSAVKDELFPSWIYYKALGLYFCNYNSENPKNAYIEFDKNVSLGKLRSGMNYKQISSKLGKSRVIETIEYAPDYRWYHVTYKRNNYNLEFLSEYNDLTDSKMQMVQTNPNYKTRMYDNLYWEFIGSDTKAVLIYDGKRYPINITNGSQLIPIYDEKEYKEYNIPDEALGACAFTMYSKGDADCFYVTVQNDKIKVFKRIDNMEGEITQKPFEEAMSIDINDFTETNSKINQGNKLVTLENPPMDYYLSKNAINKDVKPLKTPLYSQKSNNITDDDKWFKDNKLSISRYQVTSLDQKGNIPTFVDKTYNNLIITEAFFDESYIYCTYGANYSEGYIINIYSKETKDRLYSLDFSDYRYSKDFIDRDYYYIQQRVNWATIKNNTLYISSSHNTYANSSCNMNAYITAINLDNYEILWRSKPLVSNAENFLIINDVIVCGYGFTNEPDYLYQLNINTGEIIKQTPVKSAASYIIRKGNYLYVRTYNTDYVYKLAE